MTSASSKLSFHFVKSYICNTIKTFTSVVIFSQKIRLSRKPRKLFQLSIECLLFLLQICSISNLLV